MPSPELNLAIAAFSASETATALMSGLGRRLAAAFNSALSFELNSTKPSGHLAPPSIQVLILSICSLVKGSPFGGIISSWSEGRTIRLNNSLSPDSPGLSADKASFNESNLKSPFCFFDPWQSIHRASKTLCTDLEKSASAAIP